jgi:hypothetical protein
MDPVVAFGALLIALGIGLMWGFVLGCRQTHAEYAERAKKASKANIHVNLEPGDPGPIGTVPVMRKVRP